MIVPLDIIRSFRNYPGIIKDRLPLVVAGSYLTPLIKGIDDIGRMIGRGQGSKVMEIEIND